MSLGAPPHPGAAWRQLADRESGFPYYWNTATNQVRWDVPLELVQYRQSITPPPLPTNPPLPNDPPPSANGAGPSQSSVGPNETSTGSGQPAAIGPQLPPHLVSARNIPQNPSNVTAPQQPAVSSKPPHTSGAKTSLIAYDDSDSETDEKVAEQEPSKISNKEEHTTEDILALLEAEKPPDYLVPKTTTKNQIGSIATPSNGVSTTANGVGSQYTAGAAPPASNHFFAPPPPVTVSHPPLPVRRPQLGSMLQLACNYGHESGSDDEEDEQMVKKKPKKIMDGQLDSAGRMFFTETREQREAKERQKEKQRLEEEERRDEAAKSGAGGGGRKKRLALPGGRPRFNKADLVTEQQAEDEEREIEERMLRYMEYQRQESPPAEPSKEDQASTKEADTKMLTDAEAASEEAAELVEKLEYFKVAKEKVSTLKTLAIKLETLYTAWSAGALSLSYLSATLASSKMLLAEAELSLVEAPWKPTWDRTLKTYTFSNSLTGEHQGPKPEAGATPPPLPPPEESERPPLPPAPAPRAASATAPTPPPDTDQCPAPEPAPPTPTTLQLVAGYGDMEIEEEQEELPADSMTDEMASFYSSLEPEEEQIEETAEDSDYASTQAPAWAGKEVLRPSPASDPSTATMSPTSSTPSSPLPVEPKSKKRKKVKVSNNIALKKKGVGEMLQKWNLINKS